MIKNLFKVAKFFSVKSYLIFHQNILFSTLIFCLVFSVTAYFSLISTDTHHDGIMFKPALDVAGGKILFRETFTQYGAFTTFIQALALYLFGDYLAVIKIQTALAYAVLGLLLFEIWQRILPRTLAAISILFWIIINPVLVSTTFPWSTVFALNFIAASLYFLIKFIENSNPVNLFFAGITANLVFWCRQPTGIVFILSLMTYMLILLYVKRETFCYFLKNYKYLFLGFFIPTFLILIWIYKNHALYDFWLQSVKFSFVFGEAYKSVNFTDLLSVFFPYPYNKWSGGYLWNVFPVISLVVFFYSIWDIKFKKNRSKQSEILLLISFIALSNWHLYYPFPDFMKSFWGSSIMVGLLTYSIYRLVTFNGGGLKFFFTCIIALLIYAKDFSSRLPTIKNYYSSAKFSIDDVKVLYGMRFFKEQSEHLSDFSLAMNQYLYEHPTKKVINATTDALYLTFADSKRVGSFHPAYVKWTILQYIIYPDYQNKMIDYVNKNKPLIIAYLPPNTKVNKDINGIASVFNGEETFIGYRVLQEFKGGLSLLCPI